MNHSETLHSARQYDNRALCKMLERFIDLKKKENSRQYLEYIYVKKMGVMVNGNLYVIVVYDGHGTDILSCYIPQTTGVPFTNLDWL